MIPFLKIPELSSVSINSFEMRQFTTELQSKLYYDLRSVGQSVLVSDSHLGLMTTLLLLSDSYGSVEMVHPL
jgi:hypothetical protein